MLSDHSNPVIFSGASGSEPESQSDARRQYTLKGVESEAIELMRLAANSQGVKIGHWVSDRLKEAALSALKNDDRQRQVIRKIADLPSVNLAEEDAGDLRDRILRLEKDVQELLRGQRDILQLVLTKLL